MTLAIDGTSSSSFTSGTAGGISLTTSLGGDNIVIAVMSTTTSGTGSASVLSITGGGLTFTRRGFQFIDPFNSQACTFEYWVARAPSALIEIFEIVLSQVADVCAIAAFAVHTPNLISPFETQFGGLPIVSSNATGAGNPPIAGQLNTFSVNDLVFGIRFTNVSGITGGVPGDGGVLGLFNTVVSCDVSGTEAHIFIEDIIVPDAGVQVVVYEDTNRDYWVMFADAFVEGNESQDITVYPSPNQIDPENLFVAVEIDVYDRYNLETKKLQIVNRGPFFDGDGNQFYLGLGLPISLGIRISADVYGQTLRGTTEGGDINFEINGVEEWFDTRRFHWINREFRVYTGYSQEGLLSDLSLVYTGLISDMTHNFYVATLKTTDKSNLINKPLLTTTYNDTFPTGIQGKLKPKLFGNVTNLEPVLEDEVNLIYRITIPPVSGDALDFVSEVRVGGVVWDRLDVGPPGAGQWTPDLTDGTIQLGSVTLGGEVRCDARALGYNSLFTGDLLQEIVELAGGSVDGDSERFFSSQSDDLVGYYTGTSSLNVLDVLDEITKRQGGFWTCSVSGDVLYKPLTYPTGPFVDPDTLYLGQVEIKDIVQSKLIPAVWRVRPEYRPNWTPVTQFFEGVTDDEKAAQGSSGIMLDLDSFTGLFDTQVKDLDPAAGDIVINTICHDANGAYAIGSRLFAGWRFERRLFDVKAYCDPNLVKIYGKVNLKFGFMNLPGLAHRAVMVIGGGPNEFQVWG